MNLTQVFEGRGCLKTHGAALKTLGSRALIVTGKSSQKNGARAEVCAALERNGQSYALFEDAVPDPDLDCVYSGLAACKEAGADFLVGIGGGSPMDAAKAIAILAVEARTREAVFSGGYGERALPLACIPTTAGTGSEVTQYSVLTDRNRRTKTSISSPALFPRLAFLDGRFLDRLPERIAVNPALDAFSHAAESLLARTSDETSRAFAMESLKISYPILQKMPNITADQRDAMLHASMLAGRAIAVTGTTVVHGMGYFLTYDYGIAHGRANGLLLRETFRLCAEKNVPAYQDILEACRDTPDGVAATLDRLLGAREDIPRETLLSYAARMVGNKNVKKSSYEPTEAEFERIYLRSFGK